jgi:hypothetical protein
MHRFLLGIVVVLLTPGVGITESTQEPPADREFRNRCRAHCYYTAAVGSGDDQVRMALLNEAIKLDPKHSRAYYNRGVIFIRRGEQAKARADFEKAVELEPGYVNAHYNLACVLALESREGDALAALEKALQAGYRKFDKIGGDPDLKILHDDPALAALVDKYRAAHDPAKASLLEKMQVLTPQERAGALIAAVEKSAPEATAAALWLAQDGQFESRTIAIGVLRKLDRPESKPALVRGLYDADGYVNKAAANALISYGKSVERLVAPVLDDRDTGAPFFAMQVLAKIGATDMTEKIVPFLRDETPFTRIAAAESLANLGAVNAIPEVEAALKHLPKDPEEHEFYKINIGMSLGRLHNLKKAGGSKNEKP